MRAVVQRVRQASVSVEGRVVGAIERGLAGFIDRSHATSADQLKDFELRKEPGHDLNRRRNEAGITATLAARGGAEARFHQALRADPLRRAGGQRFPATRTCSLRIHDCLSTCF